MGTDIAQKIPWEKWIDFSKDGSYIVSPFLECVGTIFFTSHEID